MPIPTFSPLSKAIAWVGTILSLAIFLLLMVSFLDTLVFNTNIIMEFLVSTN